jgi:acylphosphatase
MIKHLNITITGSVQGVFFRANALKEAQKYGIKGFIRNETSGDVYLEAEGIDEGLGHFLEWCGHGPEHAKVERLQIEEAPILHFKVFEIRK